MLKQFQNPPATFTTNATSGKNDELQQNHKMFPKRSSYKNHDSKRAAEAQALEHIDYAY